MIHSPYQGMQDVQPRAHCPVCGAELYEYDGDFCSPECEAECEKEFEEYE